ncbi:scaffolding protein [Bacteriophage Phi NF-1]|uniref:Scaffolding protein n=1 Tax=Bacteriophage Phi NF-1 TaxID=2900273 RepID=A0A976QWN3_9CAUD|nr:scaffolding protein [Bacteriophage Phi NF-1]
MADDNINGVQPAPTGTPTPPAGHGGAQFAGQSPGWVANPGGMGNTGTFTQEQVKAMVADAVAKATQGLPKAPPTSFNSNGTPNTSPHAANHEPLVDFGGSLNSFDVNSIDDPVLRSMATMFKSSVPDMDLDRALANAISYGDPNLIDIAYIKDKAGQNAPHLINLAAGIVNTINAQSEAMEQSVYQEVGGRQVWDASVAVFNRSASPEIKATVATMLDSGKANLIKAGARMVAEFGKSSGMIPKDGFRLDPVSAPYANQGLSKAQFQQEILKLDSNAPDYADKYNALIQRRVVGKRLNLN